jgi:hypothetical protein
VLPAEKYSTHRFEYISWHGFGQDIGGLFGR